MSAIELTVTEEDLREVLDLLSECVETLRAHDGFGDNELADRILAKLQKMAKVVE